MIARNFYKKPRLPCVPFLERPERRFVEQPFLRDMVIREVNEAFYTQNKVRVGRRLR